MNANLLGSYVYKALGSSNSNDPETDIWLKLEQEQIPDNYDEVSMVDVSAMMSKVLRGSSAKAYAGEHCPYVLLSSDKVTVSLNIYVWPCDPTLDYELTADFGSIGGKTTLLQRRTFDVIFEGSNSEFIGLDVMYAKLNPKMKVYNAFGKWLSNFSSFRDVEFLNGYALTSEKVYCVFNLDGMARGHQHRLTMEFDKASLENGVQSITNFKNNVYASWYNEASELETASLSITLPGCVATLLRTCDDGTLQGDHIGTLNAPKRLLVYFNECNGEKLGSKWTNES